MAKYDEDDEKKKRGEAISSGFKGNTGSSGMSRAYENLKAGFSSAAKALGVKDDDEDDDKKKKKGS